MKKLGYFSLLLMIKLQKEYKNPRDPYGAGPLEARGPGPGPIRPIGKTEKKN